MDNMLIVQCLSSLIASVAFCIQFNIKKNHIIVASIGGLICQLIFSFMEMNNISETLNYFISASSISAYSEFMARRLHVPVNMYLVIAIIPLVPGRYIYDAMITLVGGDTSGFITQAMQTFGIAGSIAMGVFAVSSVVRVFRTIMKLGI